MAPSRDLRTRQTSISGSGETGAGEGSSLAQSSMEVGYQCGLCDQQTGEDAIGCDKCSSWFHPKTDCTGLSSDAINIILTEGGEAIKFICGLCRCKPSSSKRTGPSNSDTSVALTQIFEIVKALAVNVAKMSEVMNRVCESGIQSRETSRAVGSESFGRRELYAELYEFEERKKRAKSIIVKGIEAANDNIFGTKFSQVCGSLIPGDSSEISGDVFCINREKKIFRVTLVSKDHKAELVSKAKSLKDHPEFSNVFISRDLTYKQRQELIEKREVSRSQSNNALLGPPSAILSGANSIPVLTPSIPAPSATGGGRVNFH